MRNDLHRGWHEATTVMERSLSSVFAGESEREDPFFLFSCLTITTTARREPANKLALWLCWLATKQGGGGLSRRLLAADNDGQPHGQTPETVVVVVVVVDDDRCEQEEIVEAAAVAADSF